MRVLSVRWVLLLAAGLVSCAHDRAPPNPVTGYITPDYFRFRDVVVPPIDDDPDTKGGWRAVCINAQIKQGDSGAKTICKFEVGMPIRNIDSEEISVEYARGAAASMANRSAREVLSQAHPGEMLAVLCNRFKQVYGLMLGAKIKGSRVGPCLTKGIETVDFGISTEPEPTP